MIVVKARCESEELLVFRSLHLRMGLSGEDAQYYSNLEKGYEGECKFDELAGRHLSDDWLAVNDLLLEHNNRLFQIDSALLRHGAIFINDVKNFYGDYIFKDGKWYSAYGIEIDDPLKQLEGCESKLRRLLSELGFSPSIESRLVFVNPLFYLFQVPPNLPIIYPAHLNRYMNRLKFLKVGKSTESPLLLAQKLVSLHKKKSPYTRVPPFTYDGLKKGVIGGCRHGFMVVYNKETLICSECGCKEAVESAVLRSVEELQRLFPELPITVRVVKDWCVIINSKKIWRILRKNFELNGNGKASFYVKKEK